MSSVILVLEMQSVLQGTHNSIVITKNCLLVSMAHSITRQSYILYTCCVLTAVVSPEDSAAKTHERPF
jgi:hypothetical protein